ncbi:MAG: PEGA domain-containing protein [Pseudomonadota bacterium]
MKYKFIIIICLFCPSFLMANDKPSWTNKSSWQESEYKYYVGVSSNNKTEEDARRKAYENAINELVQSSFGGILKIDIKSYQTIKDTSFYRDISFEVDRVNISGVESMDIYIEKDKKKYTCWRLLKISDLEVDKERNRLKDALKLEGNKKDITNMSDNIIGFKNKHSKTTGSLKITTSPARAEIYLNGEPIGFSNILFGKIWPGEYELLIDKKSYKPIKRKVIIASGIKSNLNIKLEKEKGTIKIESNAPKTEIFVNNKYAGLAPTSVNLPVDSYNIRLEAIGYYPLKVKVKVYPNYTEVKKLNLEPIPAKLTILSDPESANVFTSEMKMIGKTPLKGLDYMPGKHKLLITKDGFENQTVQVSLEPGRGSSYKETLVPVDSLSFNEISTESENELIDNPSEYKGCRFISILFYGTSLASGIIGAISVFDAIEAKEDYNNASSASTASSYREQTESATERAYILGSVSVFSMAMALTLEIFVLPKYMKPTAFLTKDFKGVMLTYDF